MCDLEAARRHAQLGAPPDAEVAHWIIEAPWSSEVVHSYSIVLVHLRPIVGWSEVARYLDGATHGLALWAISPQTDRERLLREPVYPLDWLQPAIFAAQIVARDDGEAAQRVVHAVELVCAGRLSPHPTRVRDWAEIFGYNMLARARPLLPAGGSRDA